MGDANMEKLNSDGTVRKYATGTHTLADHHHHKYGKVLAKEQAKKPSAVFLNGQQEFACKSVFSFELTIYCDDTLAASVQEMGFECAVQALKEEGLALC